ncbi:MAG: hypothetical protein JSW27_21440 [Phycisphaerales bacterium]|nr:MAG: hypothetical protein JSW27_21440 [Phycisphaerales bacterium]
MNRTAFILLALLGLGSTAALVASAATVPEEATQWEYAVYRAIGNHFEWQTDSSEIYARGLPDFFRQLGVKTQLTEPGAEAALVNHFGRQGWELVDLSPPSGTRGTWVFWFKRPIR